jgi:hypothetical protein
VTIVAGLSLAIWIYLLLAHGGFWQARDTDEAAIVAPAFWPAVTAIVPARDEAEVIGRSIGSCWHRIIPAHCGSFWSTTAAATAPRRSPARGA